MDFIKKKIIRLWPLLLFGFILFAVAGLFKLVKFDIYSNILTLFFFETTGLNLKQSINGISWFVSVLFFVSIFYFYIFKYFKKTSYNFFISLLVLFGYTFLVHATNGAINGHVKTIYNVFTLGVMHGLTGMGLGYLIHEFFKYTKTQPYTDSIKSVIGYTIIEGFLLCFVVYESGFHIMPFNNKIILVMAFAVLFLTFLFKRGFISRLLDNKFSNIIGRYAFTLYMIHAPFWPYLKLFLLPYKNFFVIHPYFCICICFISCLLFAILTYHLIEIPAGKFLKKKFFPQKISRTFNKSLHT